MGVPAAGVGGVSDLAEEQQRGQAEWRPRSWEGFVEEQGGAQRWVCKDFGLFTD